MDRPHIDCDSYEGKPRTNLELGISGCDDFMVREGDLMVRLVGTVPGDLLIGIILASGDYTPENLMSMVKLMAIEGRCTVKSTVWNTLRRTAMCGFSSNLIANPFVDRHDRPLIIGQHAQLESGE